MQRPIRMPSDFLHNHKDFSDLLNILADEKRIQPALIEKDYWLMHVLYGLRKQGFEFELKGGTSLSKGYKIIDRFSEDIDIHIKPPLELKVEENPNKNKPGHKESRRKYFDWLAKEIKIAGVISNERDHAFDNTNTFRNGGIRLLYESKTAGIPGVKEGILLEAGFDKVTPYNRLTISSWAYDRALTISGIAIIDNRAIDIACYHPGYTFVEKLQTIATKFRQFQASAVLQLNLMRQYYDLYCLLNNPEVQKFISTKEFEKHKIDRFPNQDLVVPVAKNEAFLLSDLKIRAAFRKSYEETEALYYNGQPDFDKLLVRIKSNIDKL
jgi:hypothetical protein